MDRPSNSRILSDSDLVVECGKRGEQAARSARALLAFQAPEGALVLPQKSRADSALVGLQYLGRWRNHVRVDEGMLILTAIMLPA